MITLFVSKNGWKVHVVDSELRHTELGKRISVCFSVSSSAAQDLTPQQLAEHEPCKTCTEKDPKYRQAYDDLVKAAA